MNAEVTEVATCRYKVAVTVPAADVNQRFNKAYGEVAHQVNLKGFRKGRVPAAVLRRRYGKEIGDDVTYKMFEETFTDALKEKGLYALGAPDVDFEQLTATPDADFSYVTEVDVRPQFELPQFDDLKLTATADEVTEAKIDARINEVWLRLSPPKDAQLPADALAEKPPLEMNKLLEIFKVKTEAELREFFKKRLISEAEAENYQHYKEQVLEQLVAQAKFDLPADYVKRQTEQMLKQQEEMTAMKKNNAAEDGGENSVAAATATPDDLRAKTQKETEDMVRRMVILDTVATQENIGIAEQDVATYVENFSRNYGIAPLEIYKLIRRPQFAARITNEIITEKTLKFIVDKVKK